MGSLLSRSSTVRSEEKKSKWRKRKGKRLEQSDTLAEGNEFVVQNNNEKQNSNGDVINVYDEWNKRIDQQHLSNVNDPPGAPSTYSPNYSVAQNDIMNQSWSSPHDANNSFYQANSLSMTNASNNPYDSNQYHNIFLNSLQQAVPEERPSKKVQFAHPLQHQQQTPSKNALTSTQSWHEPSVAHNDVSTSTIIMQEPALNRQSTHRSVIVMPNTSTGQVFIQKPIYVGIDHKATLAERGQQTASSKRHHKTSDKNHFDGVDSNTKTHRTRAHTHHQHKHQELNDLSNSKVNNQPNKFMDPLQVKASSPHHSLTTTSTSTIIPNKHIEQHGFIDNDIKQSKSRNTRHQRSEQQSLVDNELKLSRSRGSHPQPQPQRQQQQQQHQHHHQQQRTSSTPPNQSPLRMETSAKSRRTENKHPNSPMMRIPISQQQQQQQPQRQKVSSVPSTGTTSTNITRTRV